MLQNCKEALQQLKVIQGCKWALLHRIKLSQILPKTFRRAKRTIPYKVY